MQWDFFSEWSIKMLIQCPFSALLQKSFEWGYIKLIIYIFIDEQLQPWDNEDPEQFIKDHTGLKPDPASFRMMPIERHTGLIWEDRENTPEQQMALDELYRSLDRSIPASYDNRAKGIPDCKIVIHNLMTHERYRFLKILCMYIP